MPEGSDVTRPWHPRCCEVPMWLVEIQKADPINQHVFECKVCDNRTVQPADIGCRALQRHSAHWLWR